jgi:YVTN family beta-propeller protein
VNEPAPKPSERRPELPTALDGVIARALAKAPEKRYGSGRELVEAAREALPASVPPAPRSRKRALLLAAALATAVLAVALPLALSGGGKHGPSTKPTLAVTTHSIQRIDPHTNKVVATIALPVTPFLLAYGGGSLWAASTDEDRLFRVDPKRNAVEETIHTIQPTALSFGAGSLWVLDASDGVVTQLDPVTGAASATVPLPPGAAPSPPLLMKAGDEGVWVAWAGGTGNAVRIDPVSTAAREVTIGSPQTFVLDFAPVGSSVWALAPESRRPLYDVVQLDQRNLRAAPVPTRAQVDYGFLAADENGVWVTNPGRDRVLHVRAGTLRVDHVTPVGLAPFLVSEGEGAVWVANIESGTVSRIDPETGKVVATIPVGPSPGAIAVGGGAVWVDVHPR